MWRSVLPPRRSAGCLPGERGRGAHLSYRFRYGCDSLAWLCLSKEETKVFTSIHNEFRSWLFLGTTSKRVCVHACVCVRAHARVQKGGAVWRGPVKRSSSALEKTGGTNPPGRKGSFNCLNLGFIPHPNRGFTECPCSVTPPRDLARLALPPRPCRRPQGVFRGG